MSPQPTPPAVGNRTRIGAWADFVYLRRGGVTHVLPFGAHTDVITYPSALCGRSPAWSCSWLGTGSQGEVDQARRMPLCIRCMNLSKGRTR